MTSWNTGPPSEPPDQSAARPDQYPVQRPKQYPPNNSGHTYTPADFPYGGYPGDLSSPAPPFAGSGYPSVSPGYPPASPGYPSMPPVGYPSPLRRPGQPASMGDRLLAKLIDIAMTVLPFAIVYVWATQTHHEQAATVISLVSAVATFVYETYFISTRGATIGKAARGLQVVDAQTGQRLSPGRAFLRSFVQGLSNYVLLAGCWSPFLDRPRLRGWHDKAAGDVVINSR